MIMFVTGLLCKPSLEVDTRDYNMQLEFILVYIGVLGKTQNVCLLCSFAK